MRCVLLMTILAVSPTSAQAGAIALQARGRAAVTLFQTYCLPKPLDFGIVSGRATQAGLKLIADRRVGGALYKQWIVPDATGLLSLHVIGNANALAPPKFMCGVFVPGGPALVMEPLLSADTRLGPPSKHLKTDAKSVFIWSTNVGPKRDDTQVIMIYGTQRFAGTTIDLAVGFPPE